MKNLSNGIIYDNEAFHVAFGEYLLTNGYRCYNEGKALVFSNAFTKIYVRHDNIDVFSFKPEETEGKWVYTQTHTGIQQMEVVNFMLLMHAMNIVSLSQYLKNTKAMNHQLYVEAQTLIKSLITTQIPALA